MKFEEMLRDKDAVEGVIEWLKSQELTINVGAVQSTHDEHIESSAGWLLRLLQNLPEESTKMIREAGMRKLPLQDETLRKILAVELPATYRNHLRYPGAGPESAKQTEKDIIKAEKIHDAVIGGMLAGVEWKDYLAVSEDSTVDLCIRNLIEDSTEDNAVCTVRAILDAFQRMKLP